MRSFWSDPYLWIHAAGVAAVPLWLLVCLLGLAAGDPVLPSWLELIAVAAVGIAPIAWMQWERPFYFYSLLVVMLNPEGLNDDQRRVLGLVKARRNPLVLALAAGSLFILLRQIYHLSAIAIELTPIPNRFLGLGVAAVAFLLANLFLQVPLCMAQVLLTPEAEFSQTDPYPATAVLSDFTAIGVPVARIVPELTDEEARPAGN
jgi:hypothetical protein